MIDSVSAASTAGLPTAMGKAVSNGQALEVALLKKGQQVDKAQAEAMLKLVDSAQVARPGGIDVRV